MAITTSAMNPRANMLRRREMASRSSALKRQGEAERKAKEVAQRGSKGSMLGTGLGLLGAVGLTLLTGGAAAPGLMGAVKTVAASPLLAGISGGVGSYLGQKGNLAGAKGAAKQLERLSSFTDMGPGSARFAKDLRTSYGGAVGDLEDAALTQGISRGMQIGSLAGGIDAIGGAKSFAPGTQPTILDWLRKGKKALPGSEPKPLIV